MLYFHCLKKESKFFGKMPRLIQVFTGHTYHFVGFVMLRLKPSLAKTTSMVKINSWYLVSYSENSMNLDTLNAVIFKTKS